MPIYEYYCQKCDEVQELWQSAYDEDMKECPNCEVPMQKLISKSSFQLKGGGWYADGYCKKSEKSNADKKPSESAVCSEATKNEKPACAECS